MLSDANMDVGEVKWDFHTWYLKSPDLLDDFMYRLDDGNAKFHLRIAVFYKENPGNLLYMSYDPHHQTTPVFVGKGGELINFENAWDTIKDAIVHGRKNEFLWDFSLESE